MRLLNPVVVARRVGARPGLSILQLGAPEPTVTRALLAIVGPTGGVKAELSRMVDLINQSSTVEAFDAVCIVSAPKGYLDVGTAHDIWRVLRPAGRLSISNCLMNGGFRRRDDVKTQFLAARFELIEEFGWSLAYTINFRKPMDAPH